MSFDDQVREAEQIFLGKTVVVEAERRSTEQGNAIFSKVTFEVLDRYKGEGEARVTLEFLGGTIGDESMIVEGIPTFDLGEEMVLFVSADRTRVCPVVGWSRGKFEVERAAGGEGVVMLPVEAQRAASGARARAVLRSDDRMTLTDFEGLLESKVGELDSTR